MKKFSIIIIFLILILLTGCDVQYEIDIKNDKIIEKVKIIETDKSLFDSDVSEGLTMRQYFKSIVRGDEFIIKDYKSNLIDDTDSLGLNYSKELLSGYKSSTFIDDCYDNVSITSKDGITYIDTGDNFVCYDDFVYLNNIKIVIKTNNKVISSNANEVKNNKYIWNITKDSNKRILFSYQEKSNNILIYLGIGILLLFTIFLIVYYAVSKKRNNNSI